MNWLTNFVKPKLSALVSRRNVPDNLWNNCPKCGKREYCTCNLNNIH